jgi:hypothetical protein
MTYVPMGFLHESYTLKIDDDTLPTDDGSIQSFVTLMRERPNLIVGSGGACHTGKKCGLPFRQLRLSDEIDHVSWFVIFHSDAAKILHRFRYFALFGAEDIALSLTNSIECGTSSLVARINRSITRDGLSQMNDPDITKLHSRGPNWTIYEATYCHYIRGGYRPVHWINQADNPRDDIRWPLT